MSDTKVTESKINKSKKPESEKSSSLFILSAETSLSFAVLAYLCGWVYIETYFSHFDINKSDLGIDFYAVFVYAYKAFVAFPEQIYNLLSREAEFDSKIIIESINNWWLFASVLFLFLVVLIFKKSIEFFKKKEISFKNLTTKNLTISLAMLTSVTSIAQIAGNLEGEEIKNGKSKPAIIEVSEEYRNSYGINDSFLQEFLDSNRKRLLALVWKTNTESVFVMFDADPKKICNPNAPRIVRIANAHILTIAHPSYSTNNEEERNEQCEQFQKTAEKSDELVTTIPAAEPQEQ